ncbi:MAG: hypothetical protein ACYDCQ_13435 [Dehalococcoidia bacterium]
MAAAGIPLWQRFPAAHQFLRLRLMDEVFPIAPWVACFAEVEEDECWEVTLRWPEIGFEAREQFGADELRGVYGRWSDWARARALDIADRLPV